MSWAEVLLTVKIKLVYAAGNGVVIFSTKSNPNPLSSRGGLVIIKHLASRAEKYEIPGYEKPFSVGSRRLTVSYSASETREILTYYLHLDPVGRASLLLLNQN